MRGFLFVFALIWLCQVTRVAEAQDCEDLIGYGMTCQMLPGFCSTKYAPLLCRRSCHLCVPSSTTVAPPAQSSTFPPWTETCMDHVVGMLTCPAIPNVCDDDYGKLFCRKSCAVCSLTTTAPTTTVPPATTPAVAAADDCHDLIGYGMTCQMLPYVCSSTYAPLLCKRSCKLCVPSTTDAPADSSSTYPPWTETCMDHVVGPLTCPVIPNICDDDYGKLFCRRSCAVCSPATTTTTPTTTLPPATTAAATQADDCHDLIGYGMTCQMLPYVCSSTYAPLLCKRSCKLCVPSSTEAPAESSTYPPWTETCMDHVVGPLTCPVIPNICDDDYGKLFCRKSCAVCSPATTTTTTTTLPPATTAAVTQADDCHDLIGYGMTCQMLPYVCSSTYAPLLCKRSCKLCVPSSTTDAPAETSTYPPWTETCMDHVVGPLTCPVIPNICDDDYGKLFCRRSCAVCSPATTTTTPTTLPPATTITAPNHHHPSHNTHRPSHTTHHHHHSPTTPHPPTTREAMTTTTTPTMVEETCVDRLGNGLSCVEVAQICSHPFGAIVCPRSCHVCQPNPNAVTSPPDSTTSSSQLGSCRDFVVKGMTCGDLPGVCSDLYGHIICRRFCGDCVAETTPSGLPNTTEVASFSPTRSSPAAITTPGVTSGPVTSGSSSHGGNDKTTVTAAYTPPTTTTLPLHWAKCMDHIGHGATCGSYPGFCQDDLASLLCPKFCGMCVPLMETGTFAPDTTATSSLPAESCADRVTNGLTCGDIPLVCGNAYGQRICPRFCGTCGTQGGTATSSSTPQPVTTLSPTLKPSSTLPAWLTTSVLMTTAASADQCEDNVGLGMTCDGLPGACNDPLASIICKKTCGFCDCEDHIVGMTCEDLVVKYDTNPCADEMGHKVCARFCGFC